MLEAYGMRGPWRLQKRRDLNKNRVLLLLPRTTSPTHINLSDEDADPLISILENCRHARGETTRGGTSSVPINDRESISDQEDTTRRYFVTRGSAFVVDTCVTLRRDASFASFEISEGMHLHGSCAHTTIVIVGREMFQKVTESSWCSDERLIIELDFNLRGIYL